MQQRKLKGSCGEEDCTRRTQTFFSCLVTEHISESGDCSALESNGDLFTSAESLMMFEFEGLLMHRNKSSLL